MEPVNPPEILYHYCSAQVLPEILKSRAMWLTHQSGLNDTWDTNWATRFIRDAIHRIRRDSNARLLDALEQNYFGNAPDVWVASFSRHADRLSQWRGYGNDGEGFAIGFRADAFQVTHGTPIVSTNHQHSIGLIEVLYDNAELEKRVDAVLHRYLDNPHESFFSHVLNLRSLAISFKNPAFQEESEWRIVYAPIVRTSGEMRDNQIIGALSEMRFRNSRYGIVPYFELPFGSDDTISEIVIGPKNRSEDIVMKLLLRSLGYGNSNLKRSSASYR